MRTSKACLHCADVSMKVTIASKCCAVKCAGVYVSIVECQSEIPGLPMLILTFFLLNPHILLFSFCIILVDSF